MWTKFIKGLGSAIEASFSVLTFFGNWFNIVFILVTAGFMVWWIAQMIKHTKEEKEQGLQ